MTPRPSRSGPAARWLAFGLFCLAANAPAVEPPATAGAKVDESKVASIYYVDSSGADAADDDKHGTQDSPFLTIKRAVDAAVRDKDANIGAKIIIASGTYRESLDIPSPVHADTDAPLVIEAADHDQTIIEAADAVGWEPPTWKAEGKGLFHPWPGRYLTREHVPRYPEMLILDGTVLRQVEAVAALVPGSFCVTPGADRKALTATVHALPPEDTGEAADAVFEVGTRNGGLRIERRRNVVLRGLVFQHASSPAFALHPKSEPLVAGCTLIGCSNVLIEDVLSQWNNGAGLVLAGSSTAPWSTGITLRRVRLVHDWIGLVATDLKDVLAEDCETSFNNFRGEWTGSFDPQGSAGVEAKGLHGSTWRRQRAVGNAARGLWWAGDCTDLLVEDAVVRDNLFNGLFVENCPGPSVVRGCFVSGNKLPPGGKPEVSQPAAVSFEASPDVTLENNVVAGNGMPQLGLRDVAERTDGTNFETGAKTGLRAERHVYRHNLFYGADAGQVLCDLPVGDRAGKNDFSFYYGTLDSDENCFWNPVLAEAFCTFDRTVYRRPGVDLAGWRTFLTAHASAGDGGQGDRRPEAGSTWEDPRFMEPGEGDYRLQAQSPLIDWGLPSDEGAVAQ